MGVSTDGQLSYGVMFPERFDFPWEQYEEEKWWRKVNGYTSPFEIYNEKGEYLDGKKPPESLIDQYYDHQREWDKANPFPVEIVNYCSGDYPMYILAVKESCKSNGRGYPEVINPAELVVTEEQKKVLLDFIEKYIEADADVVLDPQWYLSSYWG